MHYKLALLGFGNVGQALASLLLQKKQYLKTEFGITFSITGIATHSHGSAIDASGINITTALDIARAGGTLEALSVISEQMDIFQFINRCKSDVLFENTPVEYSSGQPAIDYIRTALNCNMHVATANKGPIVHAYRALTKLAEANGKKFFFESTVMDGAPIFSLFRSCLPASRITSFNGVLNSTTNLILSRMEDGNTFDEAVTYAQSIGIAETDPSGDVDGWDAAIKVAALVTVLMDHPLEPEQISRKGIRDISPQMISRAISAGKRWKLVCSMQTNDGEIDAKVEPKMISPDSPLYHIDGTSSIIQFETDVLGTLTLREDDPGPHTTAYGLLADFINAVI